MLIYSFKIADQKQNSDINQGLYFVAGKGNLD